MRDFTKVKKLGRTWIHEDILWLPMSCSGIAFSFTGKKLSVILAGDDGTKQPIIKQKDSARVAIYVDGVRKKEKMVKAEEVNVSIVTGLKASSHEIMILKVSEAAQSIVGIKELVTEETAEIKPAAGKKRRIEFIGDSITCGYGIDDENPEHKFKTSTEDATKAYAYRAAELLDADYSIVAYSGYGVISGYTESSIPKLDELLPPLYDRLGFSWGLARGRQIYDVKWDFTEFIPNTIVVNLGTNDDSYCKDYNDRQQHFAESYAKFLRVIRLKNPEAKIVVIYGLMGDALYPYVQEAVSKFKTMTGDENIEVHKLEGIKRHEGYTVNYHPTVMTQERLAKELVKLLGGNEESIADKSEEESIKKGE